MRKFIYLIGLLLTFSTGLAQELNAVVTVDSEQAGGNSNLQIFRTLQQQLTEFINNQQWTTEEYKNQERIDCNFTLIVTSYDGDAFSGSLQVQASRPVYNSTYNTSIYNYNDKQVNFNYKEFEPLVFNINQFNSNLISIITYHIYTIIGLDASTFELNGGDAYHEVAKQIINTASSSSFAGWKSTDGTQSRYRYNDALVSPVYKEFHATMYEYHRLGMDLMADDAKGAKNNIAASLQTLKSINDRRPNSYLLRTFFDAKVDEIKAIYSGGPAMDTSDIVESLNRMAPTRRASWAEIR
ncbi:DUF4835 domain-containing protein [Patiriisocius marinistellae]|uniref:DUF4835 domain-containing protein n=1 Tax=Patiriisocius marinistellae TaxID=2494560 RepID=A0A5J4FX78_9FLAO|nr:DUF4835 family protein [Patiriisocius marinistellae]GEQ86653.1 DUF4835 domain-containing protein [Patiriisocius marinistellae]